MKITSIPSMVPSWYDPAVAGFTKPKSWAGCKIRISVPVHLDPASELKSARLRAEKQYPGAILHVVPEFQTPAAPIVDIKAGDEKLLEHYLQQVEVPEGVEIAEVVNYLKQFLPPMGLFGVQGLTFRSAAGQNVLRFKQIKLILDKHGLTVVSGENKDWSDGRSNGAGKSSAVTLPFIPLFGRTFKGQSHDEWATQDTGGMASAMLMVDLPDSRSMFVERGRRPSSLRLYVNDHEETMADASQTQARIEQLTNLTWAVLTNSVYIGQRELGSVFGTDKERKVLFSQLLGLDRFIDAQKVISKLALKQRSVVEAIEEDVATTTILVAEVSSGAAEIKERMDLLPKVTEKDARQKGYDVGTLAAKIKENMASEVLLDKQFDESQKEFEGHLFKATDAEVLVHSICGQIESSESLEGNCPTCGAPVKPAALKTYISGLREKLEVAESEFDKHEGKKADNRRLRRQLQQRLFDLRNETKQYETKLQKSRSDEALLREQAKQRELLESMLLEKTNRSDQLAENLCLHERAKVGALADLRFIEFCAGVVGRDGLPAHMASLVAPSLNQAAAFYSQALTDGEIGIRFTAADGDIDVDVVNLHGGSKVKDQSSGEMRMASIVVALSFRDALVRHNLLILDEPSEGLDPVNAAAFGRGMNSLVERFQHVMVISHSAPLLEALVPDYRLHVIKENGVSILTEL